VFQVEITHSDKVERSRINVDYLKWYMGKFAPKRFGTERMELKTLEGIDWDNAPPEMLEKLRQSYEAEALAGDLAAAEEARKPKESGQEVKPPGD
jgi:hypothetical protein